MAWGGLVLWRGGGGADGRAGRGPNWAQMAQAPPFRYPNAVLAVDPGQRLGHQAGQHVEPVRQELAELQRRRLLLGLISLADGFWIAFELGRGVGTRVHSLTRPCG